MQAHFLGAAPQRERAAGDLGGGAGDCETETETEALLVVVRTVELLESGDVRPLLGGHA